MESNHSNLPEGMSSDRLQRAILRNREKQARKGELGPAPMASLSPVSTNKMWNSEALKLPRALEEKNAFERMPPPMPPINGNSSLVKRQSVATADNVKFTNGLSDVTKNKKSMLGKSVLPSKGSSDSLPKKIQSRDGFNWTKWLVISGWCFCLFLLLRLVFAQRGVLDYYSRQSSYHRKEMQLNQLLVENQELSKEIKLIQGNYNYQKQLVRDHLGFIAKDEHLILFDSNP